MQNNEKWRLRNSKYLHNDRWLKVRRNSYLTPAGDIVEPYYIFEQPDWVNCFIVDKDGAIILLQHYRPGVDTYLPELVSGGVDQEDDSPSMSMWRELQEEAGYTGGELQQLAISYPNAATQANKLYSFIAVGGSCNVPPRPEAGESLTVHAVSLSELTAILNDPAITFQTTHLLTIKLALNYLQERKLL